MDVDRQPDAAAAEALLDALVSAGVRRIMLYGSNGEGPALTTAQLGPFAEQVTRAWHERVPGGIVILNTSGAATADALQRAEQLLAAGPDALLLGPPSFFRHNRADLLVHYKAFGGLGVPVIVYNSPVYFGNDLDLDVVSDLLELDYVVAIKDSSRRGGPHRGSRQGPLRNRGDFEVQPGRRARAGAGAAGWGRRLHPRDREPGAGRRRPAACRRARGEWDRADQLQARVNELIGIHGIRPGIPAIKAALTLRGLCTPHASLPFTPYSDVEMLALEAFLRPFDADLAGVASMISVVTDGVVYRNAYPHIRTRHAWHPTLVHLGGPEWLVGFDLGEAPEAHRYGTRFTLTARRRVPPGPRRSGSCPPAIPRGRTPCG